MRLLPACVFLNPPPFLPFSSSRLQLVPLFFCCLSLGNFIRIVINSVAEVEREIHSGPHH